jgi:hypothetical protein
LTLGDMNGDTLPSAVTKALIARKN